MKRVACVLALKPGAILAVSRPRPPLRFGLPGGNVEPGETYEAAARRELFEETGLRAPKLRRVYMRNTGDAIVMTFYAPIVTGCIRSSNEGWARWVEPGVLTCPGAAFPGYTREVLRAVGYPTPPCFF